jgi:periplasmic copper chaperone A
MNRFIHRRAVLQGGLALCASLIVPPVRACEYFTGTLRITHPWTRATGPDTFAALCMKFDEVTETDRLIGVETPVAARAELIGEGAGPGVSLLIPAGRETMLSEDGTHIRLVELKHPLLIGRSYPLQLAFEKGGTANYRLSVDYLRPFLPFPGGHRS